MPECLPESAGEPNVTVGDDAPQDSMKVNDFVEEEPGCVGSVRGFRACDEVGHLTESVDHYQDGNQLTSSLG